jgi:hypothetical protein
MIKSLNHFRTGLILIRMHSPAGVDTNPDPGSPETFSGILIVEGYPELGQPV